MSWLLADRPVRSVLVSRLRYLGDVVMSTVVLEALRAGDPALRLGFLCEQRHGAVLADQPGLEQVHLLGGVRRSADATARAALSGRAEDRAAGTWQMVRELRRARYDLAVDLFFNPRSAWLLRLSGIRGRIGGTARWRRRLYTHTVIADEAKRRAPGLTRVAPGGLGDHLARLAPLTHAESGLDFLSWLEREYAGRELRPRLAAPRRTVAIPYRVVAPGATWRSKEWPLASWCSLLRAWAAGPGPRLRVLVPPGRSDIRRALREGLAEGSVEILPDLELGAVKNLLADAAGLVTVDGGVMHMGVALGVPTVALFGPTDPAIWFPYENMGPFRVLATRPACHPCDRHECGEFICLPDLSPERVKDAVAALMDNGRASGNRGER